MNEKEIRLNIYEEILDAMEKAEKKNLSLYAFLEGYLEKAIELTEREK